MLLSFFQWSETSAMGVAVRNSIWAFPVIEAIHLLGLCLLGGAVLLVDLRLLGVGLRRARIHDLIRTVHPWMVASVVLLIATGIPLYTAVAVKLYYNTSWWVKITSLPLAIIFTFVVRKQLLRRPDLDTTLATRAVGATSILLWFTVAAAGRWIGFS